MNKLLFVLLLTISSSFYSCLSFKGISIPPDVNTFNVVNFTDRSRSSIPNLDIDFTIKLRDQVRQNSRLLFTNQDPDVVFEGEITYFNVQPVSPNANNEVDYNKLVIKVKVNYYSDKNDELGFDKTFEHFEQFPATELLVDVQDQLTEEIFDQIVEQVFNEAFTNW